MECAWDIMAEVAELVKPPDRVTVPESAERNVILDIKGGYFGNWSNQPTRLLVAPAECLTSRHYDAVIFVAPAQTGKTQALVDNWIFHTICHDPVDFLLVEKSEGEARKHSKTKIDRTIRASPNIAAKLAKGHGDNVHEKRTKSGAFIWIKWPTKNTLSGATISRIALTDYDRFPDDIDGEGPAFDLAYSRRTYFGSRGMVLVESSPSKRIINPKWTASTPHESPPTIGIGGLFNTGDRRLVYSQCPHCRDWISLSSSPDVISVPQGITDPWEIGKRASLICPAAGCLISQDDEREFKRNGRWVKEGQTIDDDGHLQDDGVVARRASFWLSGWFASFSTWGEIITEYQIAKRQYEITGDDESVKTAVNTKIGGVFWSAADRASAEDSAMIAGRRESTWARYRVPEKARVIFALVDVQKRSFEVAIIARGPDAERWLMERFSMRRTEKTHDQIRPASFAEHWDELTSRVLRSSYRLPGGLSLKVHAMGIDSGGEAGATERAYDYWRALEPADRGRTILVRGVGSIAGGMLTRMTRPDSRGRKDRPTGGRGDVPVLQIFANRAKDAVNADLMRTEPGRGFIHFPEWMTSSQLRELQAESRDDKGRWIKIAARKNELFDLLVYEHGMWNHLSRGDKINWDSPPHWLADWPANSNAIDRDQRKIVANRPAKAMHITSRRRGLL